MHSKFSTLSRFLLPIVVLLVVAPFVFLTYLTSEQLHLIKVHTQERVSVMVDVLEIKGISQKNAAAILSEQTIQRALNQETALKNTVMYVLDPQNKVLAHSNNMRLGQVEKLAHTRPGDWEFVSGAANHGQFNVVIAYPLHEARALGLQKLAFLITASVLLGILLVVIILTQLQRLILRPFGTDPAIAIGVVQKIAAGDFSKDGLKASPNTLMANVLTMRDKLHTLIDQLKENSQRLSLWASVFDHAHDGIFITDAQLKILDVNPAFNKITGYIKESVISRLPSDLGFAFHDSEYFEKLLRTTDTPEKKWRGEVWNLHNDGNVYAAWLDIFAVYGEHGEVTHYVGLFSDITEAKVQQKNLEHLAYHDPLTQLPNRSLFSERLNHELAANGSDDLLAICYFDLDGFKPVNDDLGHDAGDQLLVTLATRVRACLRTNDTIARLGGDEFAILLSGLKSREEISKTLDRLLEVIKLPYEIAGNTVRISASIGYTIYPLDQSEPDTLLRHADHAMYHVKINGRGFHHQFDAEQDRKTRTFLQEREAIAKALPNGEFRLHYQPKVNLTNGKVVGLEALIRWIHPEKGLRSPAEFLPVLEQDTESAIQIGEWVITEALRQIGEWQERGLSIKVSVNISAKHMMQENFAARLEYLLNECQSVSPALLELEVTETAAIEDIAGVAKTITDCKNLGVSFALDDFGVGYSSLTYLRRLPVEVIKIDQSFIRDMLTDEDDKAVVSGVISLGHSFGLDVVAEGVETAEHGVQLLKLGCEIAQGYGIAKPMESEKVPDWVGNYQPDALWLNYNNVLRHMA